MVGNFRHRLARSICDNTQAMKVASHATLVSQEGHDPSAETCRCGGTVSPSENDLGDRITFSEQETKECKHELTFGRLPAYKNAMWDLFPLLNNPTKLRVKKCGSLAAMHWAPFLHVLFDVEWSSWHNTNTSQFVIAAGWNFEFSVFKSFCFEKAGIFRSGALPRGWVAQGSLATDQISFEEAPRCSKKWVSTSIDSFSNQKPSNCECHGQIARHLFRVKTLNVFEPNMDIFRKFPPSRWKAWSAAVGGLFGRPLRIGRYEKHLVVTSFFWCFVIFLSHDLSLFSNFFVWQIENSFFNSWNLERFEGLPKLETTIHLCTRWTNSQKVLRDEKRDPPIFDSRIFQHKAVKSALSRPGLSFSQPGTWTAERLAQLKVGEVVISWITTWLVEHVANVKSQQKKPRLFSRWCVIFVVDWRILASQLYLVLKSIKQLSHLSTATGDRTWNLPPHQMGSPPLHLPHKTPSSFSTELLTGFQQIFTTRLLSIVWQWSPSWAFNSLAN